MQQYAESRSADEWLARASEHLARNEYAAAGAAYDRAFDLGATGGDVHVSRSVIAQRCGDGETAYRHALAAVACEPHLLAAQINAAIIEGSRLGYLAALARLDAAQALSERAPALHRVRAITLLELGRHEAALAAAETAVAQEPSNPRGHEIRMIALKQLGRDADALAALNRPDVYELSPKLRVLLGITQMEAGLRDDARGSLRAALRADPALAFAWFNLADIGVDGSDIAVLERLMTRDDLPWSDRMLLNFALGKISLAHADHARAFAHFRQGNDMRRRQLNYDVVHDENNMSALAAEFSAAALAQGLPGANLSERPIFVVGMPRSGTSLVEQLLASHHAVFGAGELKAMPRLAARRDDAGRAGWPALAAEYLETAGARAGDAARVVDKLPLNFLNVGFIRLLLPNARIIHCRRNPVDNALSCYTILFDEGNEFSYDLGELGYFYRAYQRLMNHWRAVVPPERFLEVDYEAVVVDVEGEARRLVSFCGLPWDDAVLRFHQTPRAVRTASKMQVRKPVYRTSIDRAAAFGAALDPLRRAIAVP